MKCYNELLSLVKLFKRNLPRYLDSDTWSTSQDIQYARLEKRLKNAIKNAKKEEIK